MRNSPSIIARLQKKRTEKFQNGTLLSFTDIAHPPMGFGSRPRCIGLVELENGRRVLAPLLMEKPKIGDRVRPRMVFSTVNEEGLRIYDTAFEALAEKPVEVPEEKVFPGYILAFTGPSGVGKSTVSRLVTSMFAGHTANVPILTTRRPKNGDDGEYQYMAKKEFENLWKHGEIVAVAKIASSSEDRWYGYRAGDINAIWAQGKLPVVVTEMHLLQDLAAHYGRRSILSFGLLPPGKSKRMMLSHLLFRLRQRGRDTEAQIRERIKNAVQDLKFFRERADLFDHILVNEKLEHVVEKLKPHIPGLQEA